MRLREQGKCHAGGAGRTGASSGRKVRARRDGREASGYRESDRRRTGRRREDRVRRSMARDPSVAAGAIDNVAQGSAREVAAEVVVEQRRDFGGRAGTGDVRRDGDVVESPEWVLGRERLAVEDVEDGAADAPLAERRDERILVHHGTAPDVDEPGRRL